MTFSTLFNTIYLGPGADAALLQTGRTPRRAYSFEESHCAAFIEKCSHVTGNIKVGVLKMSSWFLAWRDVPHMRHI